MEHKCFENKCFNCFVVVFTLNKLGATTTDLPPGVLYRVKATYKYVKEDVDELSFDVGETINVIEYDDPEDQVSLHLIKFFFWCFNAKTKLFLVSIYRKRDG